MNKDGTIEQVSHYYPYGMSFAEGVNDADNRYKYNGKELDTTNGLNLYDYDAQGLLGIALNAAGDALSSAWNSDLARSIIADSYSVGLSFGAQAGAGTGGAPLSLTLLTRGQDAGLYFTPSFSGSAGAGIGMSAGISFSKGNFTGSVSDIKASMLKGLGYTQWTPAVVPIFKFNGNK